MKFMAGALRTLLNFGCFVVGVACVSTFTDSSLRYDSRSFSLLTVNLFNQRQQNTTGRPSWKSDWIFRRERLDLIDNELKAIKPEIILFQDLLRRKGSPSESDISILSVSSMRDYIWNVFPTATYADSLEEELLAFAVGKPRQFDTELMELQQPMASAAVVRFENRKTLFINVNLHNSDSEEVSRLISFIRRAQAAHGVCARRTIVAGNLGVLLNDQWTNFIDEMRLKDSAEGFCQVESACITATPFNDLYLLAYGNSRPQRIDRIIVHESAIVYSSRRVFQESLSANPYIAQFGLDRIWGTARFGWLADLRISRCDESLGISSAL